MLADYRYDVPKLFVRHTHYTDRTYAGEEALDSCDMRIGVLAAEAMAEIDGVLEHVEPVAHQVLSELGGFLPALTVARGNVERD